MAARRPADWRPFALASLATGLSAGFGLGGLLFVALLMDGSAGRWWPAAVQAHGHAQVFGWGGLMVLGVGLHFLPRLASADPPAAGLARAAFWIIACGLALRVVGQTSLGFLEDGGAASALRFGWLTGALAELGGALLILGSLASALRSALPLRPDAAIRSVLPMLAAGFAGLLAYLAGSALVAVDAARDADLLVPFERSADLALLGLYGFLLPISLAMSIRIFPLYFRTRPAHTRLTSPGLALLAAALVLRLFDGGTAPDRLARWLLLAAIVAFVVGVRVFEPRRPLPRREVRIWQDAPGLHVVSAYLWLLAAGLTALGGARWWGLELHLLGAGFVTLLILGSGVQLIPGFARRPLRDVRYAWATLALANLAVLCRAIPAVPGFHLDADIERAAGALAGLSGLVALCVFALNLRDALLGDG